jgi:hypothetical protein
VEDKWDVIERAEAGGGEGFGGFGFWMTEAVTLSMSRLSREMHGADLHLEPRIRPAYGTRHMN